MPARPADPLAVVGRIWRAAGDNNREDAMTVKHQTAEPTREAVLRSFIS